MRSAARILTLVGLVLLAGCGPDAWTAADPGPCPQLPADVVAEVTKDLAADPSSETGLAPETGRLPAPEKPSPGGVFYRCQWPGADSGNGLQVYVSSIGSDRAVTDTEYLRGRSGPELSAGVAGYGRAYPDDEDGGARWVCADRELEVNLWHPAKGVEPVEGARRLAEALIPKLGCPAK